MAFIGQHSRSEAIEYGNRLNRSIQSLHTDIKENFVYGDPVSARNLADSISDSIPALATTKAEWVARADELEKRAASKPADQVTREIDYSVTYEAYFIKWEGFYDQLVNDVIPPVYNWDQLEAYDSEFNQFYDLYNKISGTNKNPSLPKPKTEAQINKEHPNDWSLSALFDKIPWTPILLIGGGYLLWTQRETIKEAFKESPEKKALPEKT